MRFDARDDPRAEPASSRQLHGDRGLAGDHSHRERRPGRLRHRVVPASARDRQLPAVVPAVGTALARSPLSQPGRHPRTAALLQLRAG